MRAPSRDCLREAVREGVRGDGSVIRRRPFQYSPTFDPVSLFGAGELGYFRYPGNEQGLFSDTAKATVITAEGTTIGSEKDWSPNNILIRQLTPANRPTMKLLPGSYRRVVDYTQSATATTTIGTPSMGSNCTLIRARPGIGCVINTGVTINGTQQTTTNVSAELLINRALTAAETAAATVWFNDVSGQTDQYDYSYGSDASAKYDFFRAFGHPKRCWIMMVHGGGWRTGDKVSQNVVKNKLQHYLPKGIPFFSINYPLAVGTSPLEQAAWVAQAFASVQQRAQALGLDPEAGILMGHSAGAHLACLVSVNATIRGNAGVRKWLGTICIDSAAYDLVPILANPSHLTLYNEPWNNGTDLALLNAGSPTYVLGDAANGTLPPPMLLITSTDSNPDESDPNVGPFKDLVLAKGGYAEILQTAYVHADTNIQFGALNSYTASIDAWNAAHLGI